MGLYYFILCTNWKVLTRNESTRNVLLLILIVCSLKNLSAQKVEIVLDTIYDRYMTWEGKYLLIGKQQGSVLVKGKEIEPYPVQVDRFKAGSLGVPLVQVGDRCYFLDDELKLDTTKYVDLDLQNLSDICVHAYKISCEKGNNVFVSDFVTHKTDLYLCDKSGKRLTNNLRRLTLLQSSGHYLVLTTSRKVGIMKVEK